MNRILIIEPYFGGSHKHFLEGLQKHVVADYTLMTLPARKWKRRMQLSAPWFIDQINALPEESRQFDVVLCSTFVDVAVLRGMLFQVRGWSPGTKILTYFHENQFVYPLRYNDSNQTQFPAINFNSALSSDGVAFNSVFNRDSFFSGCSNYIKRVSDMKLSGIIKRIKLKSCILYPGIDFSEIDELDWKMTREVPVIVWNHRHEHDKNPENFFQALAQLQRRGVDFRLIVLGQSFASSPSCFLEAEKDFSDKTIHFGFAESYQEYISLLGQGDIVVSTSFHEFYGISILEAVRAGCVPVLPDRLSYPELFDSKYLYDKGCLTDTLQKVLETNCRLAQATARAMTDEYSWLNLKKDYSDWFF
jgi:glycosyltransferase involved in cell wall biosynthesis